MARTPHPITQTTYQATAAGGTLDASALTAGNTAVMRGSTGNDTLIGSAGADRLDAGNGHNVMNGGAGDDQFFTNLSSARSDTIDGGAGHDSLTITMSSAQLATTAVHNALVALNTFETYTAPADATAHFVNATLGLDMTGVETVQLRVDGVVKTLDQVGAQAVAPGPVGTLLDFEDVPLTVQIQSQYFAGYLPTAYHGFDWQNANGQTVNAPFAYVPEVLHAVISGGPPHAASGNIALLCAGNGVSPLVITKHGGGDFQFTQVDVAELSFNRNFSGTSDVTFTGTKGGATVGTLTVHADETHWQTVTAAWGAIDTLTVGWTSPDGATHDYAALDNLWLS